MTTGLGQSWSVISGAILNFVVCLSFGAAPHTICIVGIKILQVSKINNMDDA